MWTFSFSLVPHPPCLFWRLGLCFSPLTLSPNYANYGKINISCYSNIKICQQNPVVLPFISVKPIWQNFWMVPFILCDFTKRYFGIILVKIFFGLY